MLGPLAGGADSPQTGLGPGATLHQKSPTHACPEPPRFPPVCQCTTGHPILCPPPPSPWIPQVHWVPPAKGTPRQLRVPFAPGAPTPTRVTAAGGAAPQQGWSMGLWPRPSGLAPPPGGLVNGAVAPPPAGLVNGIVATPPGLAPPQQGLTIARWPRPFAEAAPRCSRSSCWCVRQGAPAAVAVLLRFPLLRCRHFRAVR